MFIKCVVDIDDHQLRNANQVISSSINHLNCKEIVNIAMKCFPEMNLSVSANAVSNATYFLHSSHCSLSVHWVCVTHMQIFGTLREKEITFIRYITQRGSLYKNSLLHCLVLLRIFLNLFFMLNVEHKLTSLLRSAAAQGQPLRENNLTEVTL